MAHRESADTSSSSGVSYPAGVAGTVKNIKYSQFQDPNRKLLRNGAFNGNAIEVFADGAVWDTVNNVYLFPDRDYNVHDLQRS